VALSGDTDVPFGDVVLGKALAHLRRSLLPKLQRERGPPSRASADGLANTSGKETVDVHEENGWRCAYYLRVRERGRHAVLLKVCGAERVFYGRYSRVAVQLLGHGCGGPATAGAWRCGKAVRAASP
jgi:hypothetical protein